jgi:DnaJ-class molecular chaperone
MSTDMFFRENLYERLGVSEKSSPEEIKKAYRSLSMKWHPDKCSDKKSQEIFQNINEAYEILGNAEKREEYNMINNNPFMRMYSHGGPGMEVPIDEIFGALFGGMQGNPFGGGIHIFHNGHGQPMNFSQLNKPIPIIKNITIQIEQCMTGTVLPVEIDRWIMQNNTKVSEKETYYLTIPKGTDDNEIIILREKGNVLNDVVKGDVKFIIKVENKSSFKRSGLDLIYEKHISLKDALCGFSFQLKHLNGKQYTLNNKQGSIVSPGYKKILNNMGFTRENETGNLIIIFDIEFPEKLTDEQIEKIQQIL